MLSIVVPFCRNWLFGFTYIFRTFTKRANLNKTKDSNEQDAVWVTADREWTRGKPVLKRAAIPTRRCTCSSTGQQTTTCSLRLPTMNTSYRRYMASKWLTRKTPLRRPNRGKGIVSTKPRSINQSIDRSINQSIKILIVA